MFPTWRSRLGFGNNGGNHRRGSWPRGRTLRICAVADSGFRKHSLHLYQPVKVFLCPISIFCRCHFFRGKAHLEGVCYCGFRSKEAILPLGRDGSHAVGAKSSEIKVGPQLQKCSKPCQSTQTPPKKPWFSMGLPWVFP